MSRTQLIEGPPAPEEPAEVVETVTTKIIENPTDEEMRKYGRAPAINVSDSETVVSSRQNLNEENLSVHNSVYEVSRDNKYRHASGHISRSQAETLRSPSPTRSGRRGRSRSRPRGDEIFEEEESETVVIEPMDLIRRKSKSKRRSQREIDEDIRALEREKNRIRGNKDEVDVEVEIRERSDVRVEKDNRGRLALVRSAN